VHVLNPTFQSPMFTLILYSLKCKELILKSSWFGLKGKHNANDIANGLRFSDLCTATCMQTLGNQFGGTNVSQKFLDAIDACSLFLPHTCDAAKKARQKAETYNIIMVLGLYF
jgi:hypothetical protein